MDKKYISIAVLCLSILTVSTAANATLIFENIRDGSIWTNGGFSQNSQVLAGEFSLSSAAIANRVAWYGTMYSPDPLNTGDRWTFDIVFRDLDLPSWMPIPGVIIAKSSVVASVIDTGLDLNGERVYLFDTVFSDTALAGNTSYFLSIINTGTQNTFRWNYGLDNPFQSYGSHNEGSSWDTRLGRPLNFSLYNETVTVPEPGTVFLFGISLAAMGFARKQKV